MQALIGELKLSGQQSDRDIEYGLGGPRASAEYFES